MPGIEIKGRSKIANYRHGGRTGKFGGGRTNLLEELGRVEAEPSNPNRRAEISRVHGELNRGYAKGGRAGFAHGTPPPTPSRRALSLKEKTDPRRKKRRRVQDIRPKKEWITKKEGLSDFQKKKVAGWEALMSTVKKGGMGADRVTSKYRSPSRAMEYFADEPGSQYEGMATKKLKELKAGKYYKDRPLGVGGRAGFREGTPKFGGAAKKRKIEQTKAVKRLTTSDKAYSPKKLIVEAFKSRGTKGAGTGTAKAITDWENISEAKKEVGARLPGSRVSVYSPKDRERRGFKKGGTDKKWIQKAVDPKHKGYCTPMTKKTCTPARKALARTFKKKAKTGWG